MSLSLAKTLLIHNIHTFCQIPVHKKNLLQANLYKDDKYKPNYDKYKLGL